MAAASEKQCPKCGKEFRAPALLKRHLERKTPCELIVDLTGKDNACRYCGKGFASRPSMTRHIRQSCKVANSEDGMEKLIDRTMQRQLADQEAKIDKLTALVEKLAAGQISGAPRTDLAVNTGSVTTINGPVTNNTTVNIQPWDGDRRIDVDLAHIVAAFSENARLKEYSRLGDHELTDPDIAPPYVTELLMDLTRRAHASPETRNIYLNPRRSDQVLVHKKGGSWEVLPLIEATRLMFDGVAATTHRVTMSDAERLQLPLEAQNALSMAGMLYDDEPDEYARRAKTPMMAHLENCGPRPL